MSYLVAGCGIIGVNAIRVKDISHILSNCPLP